MSDVDKLQEVQIDSLVYGGNGMGRLSDGKAVFVPYTLPGEKALVRLVDEQPRYAVAELVQVLEPSGEREAPKCKHFGVCGGCQYQHFSYPQQVAVKRAILIEQLQRIGRIDAPSVLPMIPSPHPWNYRNAVQFHISDHGKVGYQKSGSHEVVEIEECHLPEEALNQIWPLLDMESISGIRRLSMRSGVNEDVLLNFESDALDLPEITLDLPVSVVLQSPVDTIVAAGDDAVHIAVEDRLFRVSASSFFQVNTAQAAEMVNCLLSNLPLQRDTVLMDLYCGVGLFSAFLAPKVSRVVGVEISPSACDDFAYNLDQYENVDLYQDAAENVIPHLDLSPDIVIVDPPRAGVHKTVLDAIAEKNVPFIAYVSCDPSTLARDARRLIAKGYSLDQVVPIDMFPQTAHIESISFFSKPTD